MPKTRKDVTSYMSQKLWTKNFSIITIGTMISMMGYAVSNFALGIVVYNNTNSTLLYSLFMILNTLPRVLVPMVAGPFVDRYSRKNIIVNIDTIYGFLFLFFSYISYIGYFNYTFYALLGIILGTLDSFYGVAYESLYPEFISKGNFSKAYSISSLIYPIANTIMVPIAGFTYDIVGVTPLFVFNSVTFFITQAVERLYVAIAFLEGIVLFTAYPIMAVINFLIGILGVTSFNIRISGTQNYISSDKRGRFNGMFMMITMLGSVIGQFTSGILGDHFPIPYVIAGSMVVNGIGALVIMLRNKDHVKKIYNQNI